MAKCNSCGKENEEGAKFCIDCGSPFSYTKRCARCGFENPSHAVYCGECGGELPSSEAGSGASSWGSDREPIVKKKRCWSCGAQIDLFDSTCPMCGHSESMVDTDFGGVSRSTSKPAVGGFLLIIGGILAVFNGVIIFALGPLMVDVGGSVTCCGGLEFLFGIAAVIGGISALQRSGFTWALIGAVLCLISVGPLFISSLLGLIALLMIATSKEEFS